MTTVIGARDEIQFSLVPNNDEYKKYDIHLNISPFYIKIRAKGTGVYIEFASDKVYNVICSGPPAFRLLNPGHMTDLLHGLHSSNDSDFDILW